MAVNPKTQLLKLGIGTISVFSIVGVTGWLWQAQQVAATGAPATAQVSEAQPEQHAELAPEQDTENAPDTTRERRRPQAQSDTFGDTTTQTAPSRRTRTKHS